MKTDNLHVPDENDQKLIEDHEYLQIVDKGATKEEMAAANKLADDNAAAAKQMAEEMETADETQPVRKRNWFGWWACALLALAVIGCCLYYATKDSRVSRQRTAHTTMIHRNAQFLSANDVTAEADGTVNNSGKLVTNATADANTAYVSTGTDGDYPVATVASVDRAAKNARTVDYLYYFGNDKSAIPENEVLNDIADHAKNTDADITITAYASNTGSAAYNEHLCEQRAENLENYFVAHGVKADHIKVVPGGQTSQFGSEAYNRRADIEVRYAG